MTGLIYSGFMPSDDADVLGFSIPANVFVGVQLHRLARLARRQWGDEALAARAEGLFDGIRAAIPTHAVRNGTYCFEVDGLGGCTRGDDANLPSLLGLPLVDPERLLHDEATYDATRRDILSRANPNYYCPRPHSDGCPDGRRCDRWCGVGSRHTPGERVWPMSTIVQMATSHDAAERADCLALLLDVAAKGPVGGVPTLHESYDVDHPQDYTRPQFCWVSALFARHACDACYAAQPEPMPEALVRTEAARGAEHDLD